jgi:hypothetical protein
MNFWDIPLMQESEITNWNGGQLSFFNQFNSIKCRYFPEQYIFIQFLKKTGINISLKYAFELNIKKAILSEALIAKYFEIFNLEDLGLNIPSRLIIYSNAMDVYTQKSLDDFHLKCNVRSLTQSIKRHKRSMLLKFLLYPKNWFSLFKKIEYATKSSIFTQHVNKNKY